MIERLTTLVAQGGIFVLLLLGAILVVVAAIFWGVLAGTIAGLAGLDPSLDFMIGLVGGVLGIFPTVKAAMWVRGRFIGPPEKSVEELTEVF
jgi:hypothetical protein